MENDPLPINRPRPKPLHGASAAGVSQAPARLTRSIAAALLDRFSWSDWLAAQDGMEPERRKARKVLANTTQSTRWSVVAAMQALKQARLSDAAVASMSLIIAGSNLSQAYVYESVAAQCSGNRRINPKYALTFFDTNQLGCVSEILGIRGLGWTTGGASASGNVALFQGWQLIRSGICERCLIVGAGFEFSAAELEAFEVLGAMSTRPPLTGGAQAWCRPFDRGHAGFVRGEAAAAMVLESESAAAERSGSVLAELLGASVVLDGTHLPEPSADGESRAMREAIEVAGLAPGDIDYLNAHGSSSPLGDQTECAAIHRVLGDHISQVWINSTKALTGHCLSAAGVVEAVACVLQMQGGFLHPNLNLTHPIDPALRFVGRVPREHVIRHALSNAFGFAGINSSVVLGNVRRPAAAAQAP